ncbi:MAG: nucleoside triphosphate pyrophosphohydrolase family protein [Terriglobia bacterium]
MKLREYQLEAQKTDQVPGTRKEDGRAGIMVPLLGLAGESGTLLTEYKKWLREGESYQIFKERVSEELGDILWYIANIASKEGLDLEAIAKDNLKKTRSRWLPSSGADQGRVHLFDELFPPEGQLPRQFSIEFTEEDCKGGVKVLLRHEGRALGNELTDNAYENDGYRYHDVFHLAHAAVLGWSPVMRKLMGRKRKSNEDVDRVEDGGRAIAIEEGISALVFDYAHDHAYLEGVNHVDYGILRTIKQLTRHLEVAECSEHQWQDAILQGFSVWRQLQKLRKGVVIGDLLSRTVRFAADA